MHHASSTLIPGTEGSHTQPCGVFFLIPSKIVRIFFFFPCSHGSYFFSMIFLCPYRPEPSEHVMSVPSRTMEIKTRE